MKDGRQFSRGSAFSFLLSWQRVGIMTLPLFPSLTIPFYTHIYTFLGGLACY